ncbi:TonB-dependent receptor [Sphingomonas turrisvirgatae]|uniref:TonB-dependent receptor n=1 Tax=Sphingomonas turrisvirgatae TaxID=1888892 RepID=A0A1E3M0X0_9SPHN|nr:TonB-dependent receptor [Sphingomonas turrisvirgatae]ODP39005.1 TonB-dependent receptor [Sphingomonas turrisvirgatae]
MKQAVWFACSSIALVAAMPAWAEEATTQPEPQASAGAPPREGEIVVTAQKREQTLSEIPQSISVIGGDELERQQATSFVDYAALVPGLSLQQLNPGQTRIILRGINTGGASPTAAVYIDETPFGPSTGQSNGAVLAGDLDTFDVERVEVLRGPQGTLYGANSLGGLLKFVTVAPKLGAFEGRAQAGAEITKGGDAGWNANGVLNVPLGDMLALRVSGYYRQVGGFIDTVGIAREDANDYKSYGGRASLLFQPTDNLSVRLTALAQNIRANSRSTFDADPVTLKPLPIVPATGAATGGRLTRTEYYPEQNDVDYRLYNGTASWDLGPVSLTSVTSYSELTQREVYDATYEVGAGLADALFGGPGVPPLGITFPALAGQEKFTQEVRLQSRSNDKFEWLVGGYYTHEKGRLAQQYRPFALTTGAAVDQSLTLGGVTYPTFLTADLDSVYKEYAGFGSVTLYLGDRFDITAGARYSHNEQRTRQALAGSLLVLSGGTTPDVVSGTSDENVFTWSVAPRFELSDAVTLYARVAKGYRPGGPNVVPPGAPADYPRQYRADTLISYEAGVRAETPNRTFSIDASVYYLDWRDIQVLVTYNTSIGPVSADGNGDTATSKGAEVTATLRPTRGLDVVLNVAYNDAHLDEALPNGAGSVAGDRLPYAPEWSANLSADYEWDVGSSAKAYVGGNIRLISDQFDTFDANYRTLYGRRLGVDGYATADLRAGIQFDRFNLSLYAKNVTNTLGIASVGSFGGRPSTAQTAPGTAVLAAPIRPRTLGFTLGASF